jgi:hypothetical protein
MPVAEREKNTQQEATNSVNRNGALKAAAAAAAAGAATFAARKALTHNGDDSSPGGRKQRDENGEHSTGSGASIVSSATSSAWEAASGALLPMAEDLAESAGKYVAEHSPDVVREKIVPRFIDAFNDAS